MHPLTLLQRVLVSLPALAFLLLPLLRSPDERAWFSLLAAVVYGVFMLPLIALRYWRFRYRITPQEIVIEKGVLQRKHRSIPIERVQNVQIIRSLLPRLLGTAKVKIETAGSSATEGVLEYVGRDEADRIRQVVRAYQRQQAPSLESSKESSKESSEATSSKPSLPDEAPSDDVAPEGELLFRMSLRDVLLSGSFRFSLLYLALVSVGLEMLDLLQFEAEDLVALFTSGQLHGLVATAETAPWLTGLITIAAAALLGWLTGIVVNLNRYYGFHLRRVNGKLHKQYGLLTLSEGTIPLEKVQALILRTNPLMRAFGFWRLELQTMGLDVSQHGHQVAVPFARKETVLQLAREIRPVTLPDTFISVSRLTIRRTTARLTTVLLVLIGATGTGVALFMANDIFWMPALWGLAAWPLAPAYGFARYRRLGYAEGADYFFVRSGVFSQHLWALPTEKQQVFLTSATAFQRRLGLKSLYVDTAGATRFPDANVPDLPAPTAKTLLKTLYARFQQRFTK